MAAEVHRYKVGDIEVTVLSDGFRMVPVNGNYLSNASVDDLAKALAAAGQPTDKMKNTYSPIVLNTGGKLALVDTGTSEAAYISSKGATGQLMTNLVAAGIEAGAIDTVIISHYHGDHINGLLKADKSLAFPNAEILVPANEHQFYMDDGNMSRATKGRVEGVFNNVRRVMSGEVQKRLRTYEWDKDVIPGVLAVGTPGHTPGHTSHVVSSGSSKVYVQADVTHAPFLFARNPGWHAFYDQDGPMAEATRRKVYDMLVADKMMVQGFHYPFPAHAYIEKNGSGYREVMVPWNAAI